MTVTLKAFIIAAALLVLSVFIYQYAARLQPDAARDLSDLPTFSAAGYDGSLFDADGRVSYSLNAVTLTYYDRTRRVSLKKPVIESYKYDPDDGSAQKWLLSGDFGTILIDRQALISGDVCLFPGAYDPNFKIARAQNLIYDFVSDTITSRDAVTLSGYDWNNTGTDFRADLRDNTLSYKGKPHATYYPQQR